MLQQTLFSNPIDQFFYELENPPPTYEEECSAELWQRAKQVRQYAGEEQVVFRQYDIEEEPMPAERTPEFAAGKKAALEGKQALHNPYRADTYLGHEWLNGWTVGKQLKRLSWCPEAVTETPLMRRGADCRRVVGRAEY